MFNSAWATTQNIKAEKATGGTAPHSGHGHKTLFAGPDPADPKRVLVRKLVQISPSTYCYEEIRVTPTEKGPTYHSQLFRLKGLDFKEHLTPEEIQIRGAFRAVPNVIGFSLFAKKLKIGENHFSIVENTLSKAAGSSWLEWFQDLRDRRDMASYLQMQWARN